MANLNLSEFTEKLFVADADHTFIWDTAASISKRVSRNSWLNSGELTSSAPVTISQTWGTTGIYTAFKVVATETAVASTVSNLLELWSGSTPTLKVNADKLGNFAVTGTILADSNRSAFRDGGVTIGNAGALQWSQSSTAGATRDLFLVRDAANTLALRNGAAAQTFNVYGTWSSINDYRRLSISCDNTTGAATIATNKGSGTASSNAANLILESSNVAGSYSRLAIRSGSRPIIADPGGTVFLPNSTNIGISSRETIGGSFHAFLGFQVLEFLTSGNENVVMGMRALGTATTASRNIAMGSESGSLVAAGTNNTLCDNSVFLGYDARAALSGQTNQIVIGHTAVGIGSNSVVLGNDSITKTALKGNVGIGTTSPTSKLQVSAGDVEVDTIAKGVILKSPDGTRYRVTVANGGTLSVAAV